MISYIVKGFLNIYARIFPRVKDFHWAWNTIFIYNFNQSGVSIQINNNDTVWGSHLTFIYTFHLIYSWVVFYYLNSFFFRMLFWSNILNSFHFLMWKTVHILKSVSTVQCVRSVAQSHLTLCDLLDTSPPGSSVHGVLPAGILEWVAISSSRGSSTSPTQWTWVWVNSRSWWWTGRPGVLQSMGSWRVVTWLSNWTELNWNGTIYINLEHLS